MVCTGFSELHRLLEDHADTAPAQRAHAPLAGCGEVLAAKPRTAPPVIRAAEGRSRRQGECRYTFAAAGFADNSQHLTGPEVEEEMRSTTVTAPPRRANVTVRSRTSISGAGSGTADALRVEMLAQPAAQHVDAPDDDDDGNARGIGNPGCDQQPVTPLGEDVAPARRGRRQAEAGNDSAVSVRMICATCSVETTVSTGSRCSTIW